MRTNRAGGHEMIRDLKPYPAYKDSGVPWLGKVPEHWEVRRVKTLFREKDQRNGDGCRVLLSLTRTRGIVPQAEASNRIASVVDLSKYKVCYPRDLVMNRMQAWSGMFAVSSQDGLVSPDYCVFENIEPSDVKYFEYLFKTPLLVDQFAQYSKGIGSGFNRLYTPDFGAVSVSVPPLSEQSAIVRSLNHIDRRIRHSINAKQKLIKLLEEQKQAIIFQAVTRGLDPNVRLKPSGVEWLGEVPEHWDVWQIRHFARVGNGSTPSRGNAAYWVNGTYPWINSGCVNQGLIQSADQFVTEKALGECHLPRVPSGSVLVAITGQGKTRGTAAILGVEATINQHIAFVTPKRNVVSAEYLQLAFKAAYRELRRISDDAGSTKGALTCEDISHFKVALPPLKEQGLLISAIRRELQTIEVIITTTQREISLLKEYRTRLIADVVTGKLDARDVAANLPDEAGEPEPLDDVDSLTEDELSAEVVDLDVEDEEGEGSSGRDT